MQPTLFQYFDEHAALEARNHEQLDRLDEGLDRARLAIALTDDVKQRAVRNEKFPFASEANRQAHVELYAHGVRAPRPPAGPLCVCNIGASLTDSNGSCSISCRSYLAGSRRRI